MKIGAIRVGSSKLLERGLRRELVSIICMEMQKYLWHQKTKVNEQNLGGFHALHQCASTFQNKKVIQSIEALSCALALVRKSLCDHAQLLEMDPIKLWEEEFARVIEFHRDLEAYFINDVPIWNYSQHQSTRVPIPYLEPKVAGSKPRTFLGVLANDVIELTSSK